MATIALTAQNGRQITAHAGRCRNFLVKRVHDGSIGEWEKRTLEKSETMCGSGDALPAALRDIDILITAGIGPGLQARLARLGVRVIVTDVLLPDQAIAAWVAGALLARPVVPRDASRDCECQCGGDRHHEH